MCVHMCTRVLMLHAYTCASWPMQRRYAVAKQSHAVCCCLCLQCLGVSVSKLGARCAGEACCDVFFGMDAPEPRRFRHIHWHRGLKRWVAQLRGGRGGTLDSGLCQDALARKLAAQLGVRVATLTLTPRAEKKNSKYKYVYWKRVSATRECWQGLVKGTYLGVFRTELLAAKAVARHLGVPVVELQKSPASYFLRDVVLRFRATRIYWAPGVFIPPDLEAAVQHQTVSKAMYNAEAAYEILSVQGKYGPWKHALFKAWTANGRPSSRGLPPQARADNVVAVLRSACEFMHGHNLTAWVQHCGRGVAHHSGFVPMLLRMQVIRRAASGPLHLGLSKYAFTCRRSVQVSRCLQGLLLACDKLRGVLANPPRTCQQWRRLGVWSYGRIGKRVADYGRAFGMQVWVWGGPDSTARARADGFEVAPSREAFFEETDVLSLQIRLSPSSRGIVRREDLDRMKPTALIVNTSRAELIEPGALVDALKAGRPGFAAIDTFEEEPILGAAHPLLALPNALCTPHLGFVEQDNYENYYGTAFRNAVAFAAGTPQGVVNPEALARRR